MLFLNSYQVFQLLNTACLTTRYFSDRYFSIIHTIAKLPDTEGFEVLCPILLLSSSPDVQFVLSIGSRMCEVWKYCHCHCQRQKRFICKALKCAPGDKVT